jgi:hypothetical protein
VDVIHVQGLLGMENTQLVEAATGLVIADIRRVVISVSLTTITTLSVASDNVG